MKNNTSKHFTIQIQHINCIGTTNIFACTEKYICVLCLFSPEGINVWKLYYKIYFRISNQQIAYVLACCGVVYVVDCVVASFVALPSLQRQ